MPFISNHYLHNMEKEKKPLEAHDIFGQTHEIERDESGYSEKQEALNLEIRAGEYQNLQKIKLYQQHPRQGKIVAAYQTISNRLNQLVQRYTVSRSKNSKEAEIILQELRKLRFMQEILFTALIWEVEGQLDRDMIPRDIWELIE